jgi:hypothetical protein
VPKLDALRERARRALAVPQFRAFAKAVPASDHANPAMVLSWFRAAAQLDPKGAASPAYREATEALHELAEAQNTVDRASKVYYDAVSSGLVTEQEATALWSDPAALAAKLGELRGTDQYWENPLVQEAAALMYEARSMAADDAEAPPADDPQPTDEGEGARSGEQTRYWEARGEDPSPEAEPVHPRDDDTERLSTPGPVI